MANEFFQHLEITADGCLLREIAVNNYIYKRLSYICQVERLHNVINLTSNPYYNKSAFENAEKITIHNEEDRFIIVINRKGFKPYTLTILKEFKETYVKHITNKIH